MKLTEVTQDNFQIILPKVLNSIASANFLSFDTEFTGLCTNKFHRYSALDEVEQRFTKVRDSAIHFGLMQVGITAFHWNPKKSKYACEAFAFYLFPRNQNESSSERRFSCQLSSLEFLAGHNYDFNKTFYKGVSFMSRKEEANFRENNSPLRTNDDKPLKLNDETKAFVEEQCNKIEGWMKQGAPGRLDLTPCNSFRRFLLYQEVGKRFPDLAISKQEGTAARQMKIGIAQLSVVNCQQMNKTRPRRICLPNSRPDCESWWVLDASLIS